MQMRDLEDKTFLLLIAAVTLAFAWILWPFFGAVLWGTVFAIVFAPLQRRLVRRMGLRRTAAALTTVLIVVFMVLLPLTLIAGSLLQEASNLYERLRTGELNFAAYFQQVFDALPAGATRVLDGFGLTNLGEVQARLAAGLMQGSQFLTSKAIDIGQDTFGLIISLFLMLYLLFFLLRDGDELFMRIKAAIPLRPEQQRALFSKFAIVIRATIKGNIVVAILQGRSAV